MPVWIKDKLFQRQDIIARLREMDAAIDWRTRLLFSEHHLSHAASAFFPSPFKEALVVTMDGVGEWTTTSAALGQGHRLEIFKEIHCPHSLGLLYAAFTYYTGFKVNSGEYKLMGLAPYGRPVYKDVILRELIDVKADGSYRLNMEYFGYGTSLRMTNRKFDRLFGGEARRSDSPVTQREMDLAASVQVVLEEVVLKMLRSLAAETRQRQLCLAGGVALNCVANGKILRSGIFDKIWIQPAAGDAGGALGAALAAYHMYQGQPRHADEAHDSMLGSYLGDAFSQDTIEAELRRAGAKFETLDEEHLVSAVTTELANEAAVGWFQGRMEFGPRALGARSIIADARSARMQKTLNLKVKFRESFRPFAPAILAEDAAEWFDLSGESPYMLIVADVLAKHRIAESDAQQELCGLDRLNLPRSSIPAVTHVDDSARVQTVHAATNPRFHKLLNAFKAQTGCPMLVNTSFNVRGEPLVRTPTEAFRCFMGTDLDVLAIGNCLLRKSDQDVKLKLDYKNAFALD